jgi:sigma-B regulation protein RsbU (phosphoserine phosphatase)
LIDEDSDVPVGVLAGVSFTENQIKLEIGQGIVVYSDGIIEAMNVEGQLYSEERLVQYLQQKSANSCSDIMELLEQEIRDWCGDSGFQDDLSVLMIQRRQ